jgi:hypothetical protein
MIEFGQPAALWTALSIGLPILAHMAYRRVSEKFYFPSLRFIRPSQIPRTGKRTPSDIPLLLLRILLFITLAVLLADPYWKSDVKSIPSETKEETIFAIDLSPSMAGWNGLEEAKEKSLTKLDELTGSVGLLTFGHSTTELQALTTKIDLLKPKIEALEHSWTHGNPQLMLDQVSKMFTANTIQKKLIIVSDFQRSDWQTAYHDMEKSGISYEIVQVGQKTLVDGKRKNNLSILEARAVPAGPSKVRVWTVIRNWDDEMKSVNVELFAGGEVQSMNAISVPPLGSIQSQFLVQEGDFAKAKVRILNDDEFLLDNERSLWLKAPPARRFGFWMSEQEDDETDEEKSFLKTAVASAGDSGWNRWVWDQDKADGIRLGDDQLNVELLMMLGVGTWFEDESLSDPILAFLNNGGSVLATPGEPYSSSVSVLKSAGLLNYNFIRVAGGANQTRNPFRVAALDEDSQLADVFAGKAARDLYLSAIHRFGILKTGSGAEGVSVPLRDREGRPLALVKNYNAGGRFVFLPFRMNTGWTDLPLRNSFLPLLMELVQGGKNKVVKGWPVLESGEALKGTENDFLAEIPGAYRFEDQWVEVILSGTESTPETLPISQLKESFGNAVQKDIAKPLVNSEPDVEKNPLWMWFALLASSILIIEMLWSRPHSLSTTQTKSIHA